VDRSKRNNYPGTRVPNGVKGTEHYWLRGLKQPHVYEGIPARKQSIQFGFVKHG